MSILGEAFTTLFKKPPPIVKPTEEVYALGQLPPVKVSVMAVTAAFLAAVLLAVGFVVEGLFKVLGFLSLSLIPVAGLLAWAIRTDKYEPEPKSSVLMVVGLGGVVAGVYTAVRLPQGLVFSFLGVALLELVFFLVLYGLDANRFTGREFNDHLDGAVYGLALGAGFVAFSNYLTMQAGAILYAETTATIALERFFTAVFPALTGWWICYVKAKYVSVKFGDLFAGFVAVLILRLVYEGLLTAFAALAIPVRLAATTVVGLLFLAVLVGFAGPWTTRGSGATCPGWRRWRGNEGGCDSHGLNSVPRHTCACDGSDTVAIHTARACLRLPDG